eukprot:690668-Lingulodinium_polyedra.AAC.1
MRSDMHSVAAARRVARFARSMHRPPRGGRRVECVSNETRCVAATKCIAERISEQISCESCSEM